MDIPKLTIQILGWNSAGDLPGALSILAGIPAKEVIIRYIDNGSDDESVELVRRILPEADIIELGENTGFAGGHNAGLSRCETRLVMLHNPDLRLDWSGIEKVVKVFEDESVGAAQGLLYRDEARTIIDSAGVEKTITLNGRERGAGSSDLDVFDSPANLFAVTGAAGIYRMSALREVAHEGEDFLDSDFFAYKEDVDLGWRLNNSGWRVVFVPVDQGVHVRELKGSGITGWSLRPDKIWLRLRSRRTFFSIRNWMWMMAKNASLRELWWRELFIDLRIAVFFGLSLTYPPLMKVWWEIWTGMPKMMAKRVAKEKLGS